MVITNDHLEVSSNGRESNATVLRFMMSQTEMPSIRRSTFAPFQDNGKLLGCMEQGEVFAD